VHLSAFISGSVETPLEQAAGELAFCLFRLGKPVCVGAADVEYCLPVLGNSFAADAVDAEQVGFFGGREDDGGGQAGAMMQLGDEPITIGRANDIEVSLQDDYASGRHARLFPQGSRWFLEDLGSTNGTYVDGQRLSRATVIEPGTEFRVGGTTMQLRG